jgi:TFIIF-interacting CTD phosphatase-like protein
METATPILPILDLDETLIHAAEEPLGHEHDFLIGTYRVYRRPHLAEFLTSCSAAFRLAVSTRLAGEHPLKRFEKSRCPR